MKELAGVNKDYKSLYEAEVAAHEVTSHKLQVKTKDFDEAWDILKWFPNLQYEKDLLYACMGTTEVYERDYPKGAYWVYKIKNKVAGDTMGAAVKKSQAQKLFPDKYYVGQWDLLDQPEDEEAVRLKRAKKAKF